MMKYSTLIRSDSTGALLSCGHTVSNFQVKSPYAVVCHKCIKPDPIRDDLSHEDREDVHWSAVCSMVEVIGKEG